MPCLPRADRRVILALATLHQVLVAGIIFGWTSLVPVLLDKRIFAEKCTGAEHAAYIADAGQACKAVGVSLSLAVTTGFSAVSFSAVLFGPLQDYFSVFYSRILACLCSAAGVVCFAFAPSNSELLIAAALLVGAGGGGIQLTGFSVGQLFPEAQGLATSLIAASFSISSLVFLVINKVYFSFHFDYQSIFLVYSALLLFVLASSFVWPHKFDASASAQADDKVSPLAASLHEKLLDSEHDAAASLIPVIDDSSVIRVRRKGPRNVELHHFSWKNQALSVEFVMLVVIISVQGLASNIFVSNFFSMAQELSNDASELSMATTAFSILFPLCSITTPLIGLVMDRAMLHTVIAFVVTLGIAWNTLVFIPYLKWQILT
jgi:MFS family permease